MSEQTLAGQVPVPAQSSVTLRGAGGETSQVVDIGVPLSIEEARELTEQIRSTADVLYVLIARAHAGRAWEALGYPTFADYVREEFDISRSRAYQLLNQAQVVSMIEAAVPEGTDLHISEAAARDLKDVIAEVVPDVATRTEGMAPDEAGAMVEEIVSEYRDRVRENRERREQGNARDGEDGDDDYPTGRRPGSGYDGGHGGDGDFPPPRAHQPIYDDDDGIDPMVVRRNVQAAYDLYSSLTALRSMPNVEDIVLTIPTERRVQINDALQPAIDWLTAFRDAWVAHTTAAMPAAGDSPEEDDFTDEDDGF